MPTKSMFMDAASTLTPKNKAYQKALKAFVWETFQQDHPENDVTTQTFLKKKDRIIEARVLAKQEGILAGMQEVKWFLALVKLQVIFALKDGGHVRPQETVLKLKGPISKILAAERTLLNLLQRLSGIATQTKKWTNRLPKNLKLLATRKTLWGLLDKRAVSLGGGGTHRLHLADAILVKDNHLACLENFEEGLFNILNTPKKVRFVEIELESADQITQFLEAYQKLKEKKRVRQKNIVVMLDNFKPPTLKKVIPRFKRLGLTIEVSGGITEKNLSRYALSGVDALSSSALTMSAPALDFSLDLLIAPTHE